MTVLMWMDFQMKTVKRIAVFSLFIPLALSAGDRAKPLPKPATRCFAYEGVDRIEMGSGYFTALLSLQTTGTQGNLEIESWTCADRFVNAPEDCRLLIDHIRVRVSGAVTASGQSLKFAGRTLDSYEDLLDTGKTGARYCLDSLEGPVENDTFVATHSDGCSPLTTIRLKKRRCSH